MGRTEKSQGLAPPAIRKDLRAKQARHIVNKIVPAILASNSRARRGTDGSELITDPVAASTKLVLKVDKGGEDVAYVKRKGQGRRKAQGGQDIEYEEAAPARGKTEKIGQRRNGSIENDLQHLTLNTQLSTPLSIRKHSVKVVTTDSLTAARLLASTQPKHNKKSENACVLNMASPLRPGGGVLAGATSQEEFLCARTTLLPSLKEEYYRLPEFGGIFTPDVLVFRTPGPLSDSAGELGLGERYWVDVISAGMLRFPDLEGEEDEVKRLGKKDREIVERKMRAVLRIAAAKRVKKLVLGAWGCGAYGNPVVDIAQAWSRVLYGPAGAGAKKEVSAPSEVWPGLEAVIFAIPNSRMANEFAAAFGSKVQVEEGPHRLEDNEEDEDEEHKIVEELQSKIEEMEGQIGKVWNPNLKSRLAVILDGLKAQLKERQGGNDGSEVGVNGSKATLHEDKSEGDASNELMDNECVQSEGSADEFELDTHELNGGTTLR